MTRHHPLVCAGVLLLVLAACGRGERSVIPGTPLGQAAEEWLFAHNQGDGHAMVHFTLGNRGSGAMNGAQVDSAVYSGVRFARALGPLEPQQRVTSTDSLLVVLLRSRAGDLWRAEFSPAPQPSAVKVQVRVERSP